MIQDKPAQRVANLPQVNIRTAEDFNEACVVEYDFAVVWAAQHLPSASEKRVFVDDHVRKVEQELGRLHPALSLKRRTNLTVTPLRGLMRFVIGRRIIGPIRDPLRNVGFGLSSAIRREPR